MCGIAICIHPNLEFRKSFSEKGLNLLKHRGPDGQGTWDNGKNLCLVHTRLAIQDTSEAGHQPMFSASKRFVMVFNGEIYNHLELRTVFLSDTTFIGHSDSETILALFEKMGVAVFAHLVGMWALAIYDTHEEKLVLSRDRFGQKPLFYFGKDDLFIWASEQRVLKPFISELHPNYIMISELLVGGNYGHLGSQTFIQEILHFPSSSYQLIHLQDPNPFFEKNEMYWNLPKLAKGNSYPSVSVINELKERLKSAILSQTISDRAIGVTLSGGLDSSIIVSVLLRHYPGHVHIFTAQAIGKEKDESKYVSDLLALYPKDRYTLHTVDLNDSLNLKGVLKTLEVQEEPFGDPSIVAHSLLMQKASDAGVPVILNGQGADELFFGYDYMIWGVLASSLRAFSWQGLSPWFRYLGKSGISRIILAAVFPGVEAKLRERSRKKRESDLPEQWRAEANISAMFTLNAGNVWHQGAYGISLPHLVHYDDRNAMALGIEGRSPFLDHRLWEWVANKGYKISLFGRYRKGVLREAFKEYLPKSIYKRKDKIGFTTPINQFLMNFRDSWFDSIIFANETGSKKYLQDKLHLDLVNQNKMLNGRFLWRLLIICTFENSLGVRADNVKKKMVYIYDNKQNSYL